MKNLILLICLLLLQLSFAQVKTTTSMDKMDGSVTINTEYWNHFASGQLSKLNGHLAYFDDTYIFVFEFHYGFAGCLSKSDSKIDVKLDNEEIITLTYLGDINCDERYSASFIPLDKEDMENSGYKDVIIENIDKLSSNKWVLMRLYGSKGYIDIEPKKASKKREPKDFFIEHIEAIKSSIIK